MEQDIDYKGYRIKIRQDDSCESPNDWGNEDLFLVYDHRQFYVERKGFGLRSIYEFLHTDEKELWEGHKYHNYWIFPVDAYIHSGVHISLANTKDYPDRRWMFQLVDIYW
jgi:adenine specific DNA methylase Mod